MKKINCILLVDDNPADNEYHKIIIQEANVCNQIEVATNGPKALDYIVKSGELNQPSGFLHKKELVFLDINMPKMDGFDFLEEYKKLDSKLKSKFVIIILTTSLNPDDQTKTLHDKIADGFLNKPLTVEIVQECVEKYF